MQLRFILYWNSQKTMYRRTRDIRVTTISTYVDIYFLSVPGLTGYNQGKSSSLYRPPGSCTHPHTVCGYTIQLNRGELNNLARDTKENLQEIPKGTILPPISSKNSLKNSAHSNSRKKNPNTERKKNSTLPSNRYKMVCTIKFRRSYYPQGNDFLRQKVDLKDVIKSFCFRKTSL